jgi:hypothetical protein
MFDLLNIETKLLVRCDNLVDHAFVPKLVVQVLLGSIIMVHWLYKVREDFEFGKHHPSDNCFGSSFYPSQWKKLDTIGTNIG